MKTNPSLIDRLSPAAIVVGAVLVMVGCQAEGPGPAQEVNTDPHVMAASATEAGRYLIVVGGCNDCHTDGYLATGGQIPEEDWLAGSILGWRGPWGTTYAANLRLSTEDMTEDDWVDTMHMRTDLPPMPWMNVNQMSEADARAIYQYIKSLGPKGDYMPGAVPPGEEPATPFISLEPQNMEALENG